MASDLEKQAKEAFIDDHFELAVDLYTQAIALDPKNSELYSDRAQANIKSNNLTGKQPLSLSLEISRRFFVAVSFFWDLELNLRCV